MLRTGILAHLDHADIGGIRAPINRTIQSEEILIKVNVKVNKKRMPIAFLNNI